jgi:hypothetical protein
MELQNEVLTDKTVTINDVILPDKLSSLEKPSKVYSTRRILLILVGVLLVRSKLNVLSSFKFIRFFVL